MVKRSSIADKQTKTERQEALIRDYINFRKSELSPALATTILNRDGTICAVLRSDVVDTISVNAETQTMRFFLRGRQQPVDLCCEGINKETFDKSVVDIALSIFGPYMST